MGGVYRAYRDGSGMGCANGNRHRIVAGLDHVSYFQETSYQVPKAGNRFYVVGSSVALNAAGEWFRNPDAMAKLYLWDPSSDQPEPSHTIEAKARLYGFDLSSKFLYRHSGDQSLCVHDQHQFQFELRPDQRGSRANYISQSIGITPDTQDPWGGAISRAQDRQSFSTAPTTPSKTAPSRIAPVTAFSWEAATTTVQNCTIHDVGYDGGDEAGVTTLGDNEHVSLQHHLQYLPAAQESSSVSPTRSLISHNIVHNVGLQMTDLGAIYTWGTDGEETEVSYNIVYNVQLGGLWGKAGIYLSTISRKATIVDHKSWSMAADFALKMNDPCRNDLIVNNTFVATSYGLESSGTEDMTGTLIENNIFTKHCMIGRPTADDHEQSVLSNQSAVRERSRE